MRDEMTRRTNEYEGQISKVDRVALAQKNTSGEDGLAPSITVSAIDRPFLNIFCIAVLHHHRQHSHHLRCIELYSISHVL